jgi:hypothetical protein
MCIAQCYAGRQHLGVCVVVGACQVEVECRALAEEPWRLWRARLVVSVGLHVARHIPEAQERIEVLRVLK